MTGREVRAVGVERRAGAPARPPARLSAAVLPCAAVLLSAAAALADGSAWFDKRWPVRRIVTVEAKRTAGAPGGEIGVVEIPTDKLARRDGGDLRVADAAGKLLPMRVLSVGPGSLARVAFAVRPGRNNYAIYYGRANAGPRGKELDLSISRGLLMETCTFAGGNIRSYAGTQTAFTRAKLRGAQGCDFVDNVFHGHNLFGPTGRTVSRYTGFLRIPANGRYGFATSSDDASFLAIDGELVVAWGGYHGWVGDARHNKTVTLSAGVHRFEYLHVNVASRGGAVAAWKPPGAKRWWPIPASAFLPVCRGRLRERERFGTAQSAEMTFENIGEALIGSNRYVQRYRFSGSPKGFDRGTAEFAWDFGDGISVAGVGLDAVEHVYLTDGPVDVSLTIGRGAARDSVTNRVVVTRNWRTVIRRKIDSLGSYAKTVRRYDFGKMRPAAVARAMELFERVKVPTGYMAAGHALAAAAQPVDNRVLTRRMGEYAEFLMNRSATEGPLAAVNEYLAAARRATSPFARAAMFVGAGRILLDRLGNDPKAEQMFAAALKFKDRGNDRAIKAAQIGIGDVYRRRGDGEQALAAYQAAEKMDPSPSANKAAVEVGSLARSTEYYIRRRDFATARKFLQDWDWQFPTHKLQGYSTLLWVRFYQAQKRHSQAIREASDLVAAAERSNYAPELLLASAESWLALKNRPRARQLLEHVVAVYPDSPLVADAKKRLKEIEG